MDHPPPSPAGRGSPATSDAESGPELANLVRVSASDYTSASDWTSRSTDGPMARYDWLRAAVLDWFDASARSMPWRGITDPYAILVAEVMLQQTQVDRVILAYLAFLARFPTLQSLAHAPRAQVIRAWAGLGYNRRAVNLQRAAQAALARFGGRLPEDTESLRSLPGVGDYTAAAVACFAHDAQVSVVDTNVRRVLGRFFFGQDWDQRSDRELRTLAEAALPAGMAWSWNQALMDLGATVCPARAPRCSACPLESRCRAAPHFKNGSAARPARASGGRLAEERAPYSAKTESFHGSRRYYRGRAVAFLRGLPPGASASLWEVGSAIREGFARQDVPWLVDLLKGLERDGLIAVGGEPPDLVVSLPEG